jgi:hypothetical protein
LSSALDGRRKRPPRKKTLHAGSKLQASPLCLPEGWPMGRRYLEVARA